MKNFKFWQQNDFINNVLTLLAGTTIAQIIPIAITPFITRLYTPEEFGIFALYTSVSSIVGILATGRYDQAIVLPFEDIDAANLLGLCVRISLMVSVLMSIVFFGLNSAITNLIGDPNISGWLYLIPLSILLMGIYQSLTLWIVRTKNYKHLSIIYVLQTGVTAIANLSMGFANTGGLILGTFAGQLVATIFLGRLVWQQNKYLFLNISKERQMVMAKKYIEFPKVMIFSGFIEVLSSSLPSIIISNLFGVEKLGFYNLSQRIINLPSRIIGQSIGNVFRQEASVQFSDTGNCRKIFRSTLKKLIFVATLPFACFFLAAPQLCSTILGEQWLVVGEFVRILIPMFYLQFITSPLSVMFMVAEKQRNDLYLQALLLIFIGISFVVAHTSSDIHVFLHVLTLLYCIKYLYELSQAYNFTIR